MILKRFEGNVKIMFGISPLVHDMTHEFGKERQRVFPKIMNARSDIRNFFNVDHAGVPNWNRMLNIHPHIVFCGHGLVHVDHRLLTIEQQEMSILISCALVNSKVFIPPFNKWDYKTEMVCKRNEIQLVKFEDGWLCAEYNAFDPAHDLWYLHAREFTLESFDNWLNTEKPQS